MSKSQVAQQHGLLSVSRKVVKAVIHRVATEVPGVIRLGGDSIWKRLLRRLGFRPKPRGIELELADGEAAMTLTIVVRMGARVPDVAAEVRRRIRKQLKEQLGIEVRTVNVHITSVKLGCDGGAYDEIDPSAAREASPRRRFDFDDELPI